MFRTLQLFFDATSDNVYYMKLNDYLQYTNLLFAWL